MRISQHVAHWRFQLLRLVDFNVRYAFKVFLVVRQHHEIIVKSGCPKQDIEIRNQLPPSAQERANFCKLFDNGKVESQQVKVVNK